MPAITYVVLFLFVHKSLCDFVTSQAPIFVQMDTTSGGNVWQTPSDTYTFSDAMQNLDDGKYMYSSIPYLYSFTSHLMISGWKMNIPTGSTILGIQFSIYRRSTGDGSNHLSTLSFMTFQMSKTLASN